MGPRAARRRRHGGATAAVTRASGGGGGGAQKGAIKSRGPQPPLACRLTITVATAAPATARFQAVACCRADMAGRFNHN